MSSPPAGERIGLQLGRLLVDRRTEHRAIGTLDAWAGRVIAGKRFSISENRVQMPPAQRLLHFFPSPKPVLFRLCKGSGFYQAVDQNVAFKKKISRIPPSSGLRAPSPEKELSRTCAWPSSFSPQERAGEREKTKELFRDADYY